MELTFLGKGSAFNTQLGNNSAYIKAGSSLLLLDCGGTTFSKLMEKDVSGNFLLQDVTNVTVVITHLHPDHIGSLGDLILYCYYVRKLQPKIVYPNPVDLEQLLYKMGIRNPFYYLDGLKEYNTHGYRTKDNYFFLEPIEVVHINGMFSYAYLISINDKTIYYSGDCKEIPQDMLDMLKDGNINEFYQDISGVTKDPLVDWPHLLYEDALNLFPVEVRANVYLMHQDELFNSSLATLDGFKVV